MGFLLIVPFLLLAGLSPGADPGYEAKVKKFQTEREAALKAEGGWLSLAGHFWLKPGANHLGTAPGSTVELPAGKAPQKLGVVTLRGGVATFEPARGATVTLDGQPLRTRATLRPDGKGQQPSAIGAGSLKLTFIQRGDRFALRLWDEQNDLRKNFAGTRWFPINPEWRVEARLEPAATGRVISTETLAGTKESYESAGFLVFTKGGKEYRIEAARSGDRLWLLFRDGTSGKTTYKGARQMYTPLPKDGRLTLDFNEAINLPCAYNPWTVCPLPPPQNRLTVPIEAGELDYRPR